METDWKKKYEEAIKKVELLRGYSIEGNAKIDELFPELAESEDEKIMEELIGHCKDLVRMNQDDKVMLSIYEPWLAWLERQKEQKSELPKSHKGDDTNPYDMGVSEAQEYAIKRGFSIPFNDGEVYVDERHMTQTIGNILRWADEHPKEQKQEWSEEDKWTIDLTIAVLRENLPNGYFKATPANNQNIGAIHTEELVKKLESLKNRGNSPKSNTNSPWKPSKEQMEALLWCTAHLGGADHRVLAELYEHLKKYSDGKN